jgi:hypothetical protein
MHVSIKDTKTACEDTRPWLEPEKVEVPVVTYRHVAGWAETVEARQLVIDKCESLWVRHSYDGPAFEFHANLEKTKQIEAVIDPHPQLHRFHAVRVRRGTHASMGVATPLYGDFEVERR